MTKQWCGFRDFCIASLQYLKTLQPAFSRQLHSVCRMGNIICGHMSDSPNQSCFGRWNWSIEATCTPLQGQRTSVLIYLHRLFTHVRHHKIPKGNPLIDLLTCFYYKVFLSIWDVVWIMPEYMRTYKNTYAPSPHSHLNFTEHQSLKKVVYLANRVCCHLDFIMRLLSFKVWQSLPLHPHGCRAGGASMMCQFLSICRDARASRWMVQWSRLCLFSSC